MYDGRLVANLVLDVAQRRAIPVTNLMLQKLVYFCHAWSLVERDLPLVKHEFEAWEFGPVLPYLYRAFRASGAHAIATRAQQLDVTTGRMISFTAMRIDDEARDLVERVLSYYLGLSAGALVALSHIEGGPWHSAWHHKSSINPGMHVTDDSIRNFYAMVHRPFPQSANSWTRY